MSHLLDSELTVELDHLLDDLVFGAVQVRVILKLPWVVSALLSDPLLLPGLEVTLELTIVLAYDPLGRVVETITDIVSAFRDMLEAINVVANECFAIRPESLHLLGVESPILNGTVVPLLVLELQVIVEEVFSGDELAPVPLGNIAALEWKNKS